MNWTDDLSAKVSELIKYAKNNSKFYSERIPNLDLNELTIDTFKNIPILTKDDISWNEQQMLTVSSINKLSTEHTSGSTGNPLICYKGPVEKLVKTRDLWGLRKKQGNISPNDKYVMFYAFNEKDFRTDKVLFDDNVIYLSMLDMSPSILDEYYEILIKHKPKWLLGVPSALHIFSKHIIERGYQTISLSIQYVESNGEMLFDYQKETIEKAFGSILYNHYGSREFWCLAMSCKYGHLHLLEDRFYYEVINTDEQGIGELVVTDLMNRTWPLIRYHLGDLAHDSLSTCSCGNHNRVINISGGRSQEYLKIADWIANPILFHYAVMKINNKYCNIIQNFRVTQKTEYELITELVVGREIDSTITEIFNGEIKRKLPSNVTLITKIVSSIDFTSNKFKYFIPYNKGSEIYDSSIKSY